MSDVRIPQATRLEGAQNGTLSRLGTVLSTTANGPRALQAPADTAAARGAQASTALTRGGAPRLISSPPSTPMSRLDAGALDPGSGVRSFIDNLHALQFEPTNDSDAMTSAFLKLEVTNMSTNQDMENFLNQAKHFIREAAFAVAKARVAQTLFDQAAQLERGAAKLIREAMKDSGRSNDRMSSSLDNMEHGHSTTPTLQTASITSQPDMDRNTDTQKALADMQRDLPPDSPAQSKLSRAANMLSQAQDLRSQAYATLAGIAAAERAIAEGRGDEGQFGVQRRNMETQDGIMRGLARLLGGTRADLRAREEANREARASQHEVVQLMRDFVDRDSQSSARRGRGDRI